MIRTKLFAALLGLIASATAFADTKISALPAGTTLAGTEPIPTVQSAATVATTPAAINTYVKATGTQGVPNGGTGLTTVAQGDILFGSATDTLASLAKNTNTTRYLSNQGTSNSPSWSSVNLSNGVTGDLAGTTRSGSNYTLTGSWTWNTSSAPIIINTTGPRIETIENDAGTDLTFWDWIVQGGVTSFRTRTDADGAGKTWLSASRTSTTAIATVSIGNSTDNPTVNINGSSARDASALFNTGLLPIARGGTNLATATDDNVMVGNGTTWQTKALTSCSAANSAVTYDTTANAFGCNTIASGGTVAGSDTQVQFNNAGAFGADAGFTWTSSTNVLTLGESGTAASIIGPAGTGASMTLRGGTGATTGGNTSISSGAGASSGLAGAITIQPGAAGTGGGVAGATVTIQGGTGGTTSGNGGPVNINGGNGTSTNGNAGSINLTGGTGTGSGSGGSIAIAGGPAGSTGTGGPIDITASNAGGSSGGAGGSVTLTAGNGNGTNQNGGSMTISAGVPTGSGTGALTLKTNNANRLVINANGSWATPAATTAGTVLMTVSSSAAPTFQSLNGASAGNSSIKAQRVTTGTITTASSALVTLTWGAAFGDTSYTATCDVQDSTAATLSLQVVHIETIAAGSVAVRVQNTSAGSLTGTLHCIAVHD